MESMGDFIKQYKSRDEIKRRKRFFLRREHHDNDNKTTTKMSKIQMLGTIKRTLQKKILANK